MNKKLIGLICLTAMVSALAYAAATTSSISTPAEMGRDVVLTVKSNVTINAGSLVSVDSSGYAIPAADTASTKCLGRAAYTVNNLTANYSAKASVKVERGVFQYTSATNVLTSANITDLVYVYDDQTVGLNDTNRVSNGIVAGRIVNVGSATNKLFIDTIAR